MDQLGNQMLEINFFLSTLSLENRTTSQHTLGMLNILQEKIVWLWPVQQSNLSEVLNGGQLERNANVANSKKNGTSRQHLCP